MGLNCEFDQHLLGLSDLVVARIQPNGIHHELRSPEGQSTSDERHTGEAEGSSNETSTAKKKSMSTLLVVYQIMDYYLKL